MYPLIGILAEVDDERVCRVLHAYIASIEKAGAIPLLLPFVESDAVIDSYVDLCDGFFFTGGADIAFYKKNAQTIVDKLKKLKADLNALVTAIAVQRIFFIILLRAIVFSKTFVFSHIT